MIVDTNSFNNSSTRYPAGSWRSNWS